MNAPHINEVWCGDSSVGPRLITENGKTKVYIIALIDDPSRFITGIDIFFQDNFVNLMSVMRSAVSRYGRPKVFNFDNGSSYKNRQMELLCARIGSALNYSQPYTPTAKAKIERWFRTMKDQWMDSRDRAVILLAGQPQLNNTLRLNAHEPLRQRLVMNYNMEGLSKEEGRIYVTEKLKSAGCRQTVFEENALEAVLNSANGTPPVINRICDACLLIADSKELPTVTGETAMQAINEVQLG